MNILVRRPYCQRWRVNKNGAGWLVLSPEGIHNRFNSWRVALRFAVLLAYGYPGEVMAHCFELNPADGRCSICEEHAECHWLVSGEWWFGETK